MPLPGAYGRAAAALSEEFDRVSAAIRERGRAARSYLTRCRWPDGFMCPRCARSARLSHRRRRDDGSVRPVAIRCRSQSGTILHNTKTPLAVWFWAAYLAVTDKRGLSALLLQRQLGLSRYETAWMLLHKLRRAMVNATREPLHGDVEMDDTWVGGPQPGLRGSRQLKGRKAALVRVAVEKRGPGIGPSPDGGASRTSRRRQSMPLSSEHIVPGATLYTDAYKSFDRLAATGVRHVPRHQASRSDFRRGAVLGRPVWPIERSGTCSNG